MKLIEVVPDKKVVWHVLDNYFNFTKIKANGRATKIIFEISEKNNKTQLHFTHEVWFPTMNVIMSAMMHGPII